MILDSDWLLALGRRSREAGEFRVDKDVLLAWFCCLTGCQAVTAALVWACYKLMCEREPLLWLIYWYGSTNKKTLC